MKHILLVIIASCFLACGASKTVRTSKKIIKGNWVLNSINYSKTGEYKVTLFNDASKECFLDSNWAFVPNNNTGTYTISNSSCTAGERNFAFTIQEVDEVTGLYDFLLKPTNEKGKSETNQGFRFKLNSLSDTNMQWQQTVNTNGSAFIINMNFTKQ